MLFITSWSKSLKTDPFREICTYATCIKISFFCQINTLIKLYIFATAILENSYTMGCHYKINELF